MKIVNVKKKIVGKLIDECTKTIEEVKLAKITLLVQCVLCYFGYSLQFLPELLFILFITIGLWLKIMFLALHLVFAKKQRFGKHTNGKSQTNKY